MESRFHELRLSYEDYIRMGRTFANCQIEQYYIHQLIASGGYGDVYSGFDDENKRVVALKVLDLTKIDKESSHKVREIRQRLARTEPRLMMACDSENIVKCYDVYQNKELVVMAIQHCNGGTLRQELMNKGRIAEGEAILIMAQLINGIAEMHRQRIIHRDLKAQNILIHNGVYKLADLGFSKQMKGPEQQVKQTTLGTLSSMAPEVILKQPYGVKADIWSIGVVFFEMIFGELPYTSKAANTLSMEIRNRPILKEECFRQNGYTASKEVTRFLREILVIETQGRLGWTDLLKHPLFNSSGSLEQRFTIKSVFKQQGGLNFNVFVTEQVESQQMTRMDELATQGQAHEIRKSSRSEISHGVLEVKKARQAEEELYRWVQECHLQCLKTELIFFQLVEKIIHHELLDLSDRDVTELLFLMLTRGLNNMSFINIKLKMREDYIVENLKTTVSALYAKVTARWTEYSQKLTDIENSVGSIIYDRIYKTFSSESYNQRVNYLTGIENIEYTKQAQIEFTYSYIQLLIDRMTPAEGTNLNYMRKLMARYVEINAITLKDLQDAKVTFRDYIKDMVIQ